MKSYHLTQEQVWKVAENLDYTNSSESGLKGTVLMSKSELLAFTNAVLDQVLGEPVAYQVPLRYGSKVTLNKPVKPVDWDDDFIKWDYKPLYAPKEQS